MGQNNSKVDLKTEIKYISDHTSLTEIEIACLYQDFVSRKRVTKKEFLHQFKKTFPRAVNPNAIAIRVFNTCDTDHDGTISFREFVLAVYLFTKASKKEKLERVFHVLDVDSSGYLSCQEVVQAVRQSYNIMGEMNKDFHCKGIETFRKMDIDGNMKVNEEEFLAACLENEDLCQLLETSLGEEVLTKNI